MPTLQPLVNKSKGSKVRISSTHYCMLLESLHSSQSSTFYLQRHKIDNAQVLVSNGQQAGRYLTWALLHSAVFPNLFTSMIAQVLMTSLCWRQLMQRQVTSCTSLALPAVCAKRQGSKWRLAVRWQGLAATVDCCWCSLPEYDLVWPGDSGASVGRCPALAKEGTYFRLGFGCLLC